MLVILGMVIGFLVAVAWRRRTRWRVGGADNAFEVVFLGVAWVAFAALALAFIASVGFGLALAIWSLLRPLGLPYVVTEIIGFPIGLTIGSLVGWIIRRSSRDKYGLP